MVLRLHVALVETTASEGRWGGGLALSEVIVEPVADTRAAQRRNVMTGRPLGEVAKKMNAIEDEPPLVPAHDVQR